MLPARLITIYDCKVVLEWTGTASDGTEVKGKLTIPEVSHEITLDGLSEYVVSNNSVTLRLPRVQPQSYPAFRLVWLVSQDRLVPSG